jgi:signal transduction histidine kinase
MNELYEEARTAIQAKDDFFALISHEMRTPLTSITGRAALLERDPDATTIAEAARSIASRAALQARLIDDLLDVSRIMTGKFAITEASIDLRDVIDATVSGMRPLAAAQGIALRITALQSVIVNGDDARLRQVVTNLLSNAVKFTPSGGLIETCLTRDGSFAVVEVCDTGEGISPLFLPYVVDRRAQATARRFAGLGLGARHRQAHRRTARRLSRRSQQGRRKGSDVHHPHPERGMIDDCRCKEQTANGSFAADDSKIA